MNDKGRKSHKDNSNRDKEKREREEIKGERGSMKRQGEKKEIDRDR